MILLHTVHLFAFIGGLSTLAIVSFVVAMALDSRREAFENDIRSIIDSHLADTYVVKRK